MSEPRVHPDDPRPPVDGPVMWDYSAPRRDPVPVHAIGAEKPPWFIEGYDQFTQMT